MEEDYFQDLLALPGISIWKRAAILGDVVEI
jgi:hypothetical protein